MLGVIVAEDVLLGPTRPDALDHGSVVASVREKVQVCRENSLILLS